MAGMQEKNPTHFEMNELIEVFNNRQLEKASKISLALTVKFPDNQFAWKSLGASLHQSGRFEEAVLAMQKSVDLNLNDFEAHYNLGNAYKDLGLRIQAQESYRHAIHLKPDFAQAHYNLGNTLGDLGHRTEAEICYRRAIAIKPDFAQAMYNLGNELKHSWHLTQAESNYRQAIALIPNFADAHHNLGAILQELGKLDEAAVSCRQAVTLKPELAEAHSNLGVALKKLGRLTEAEACCRQALALKPDFVEAHHNLALTLQELGRLTEADAACRQAIALKPDDAEAFTSLLFGMNYVEKFSIEQRLEEAKRFGLRMSQKAASAKFSSWKCLGAPNKLRIGFVSGDLRAHPVGYFLEGLLSNIDASKFELIAYSTQFAEDALTQKIKPFFKHWRPLFGKNDEAAAKLIHEDAPHILIDLAGHTAHNRLPVFAYKPAPIQVSWLGYFATTGLPEMDYILGDRHVTPDSEAHHFSEQIWRLPETYLCFTPPQYEIEVKPLPALVNGFMTFGCFNNLTKLNDAVLALWAKVLTALPSAKLFLKTKQLADPLVVQDTLQRFEQVGVKADRLILEGPSPRADYFESYNKVDIALDPFPFPGGTTSVEGLWMGVPVVTLKGERFISHNGQTIAHNAGQANWIANDANDYVRLALEAASDLEKLARVRTGLRAQVLAAPLFDAPRFARNFEAAMMAMALNITILKN